MEKVQAEYLEIEADEALFGENAGLPPEAALVTLHENQRPLQGLAGLLDWRFHGAISAFLQTGAIRGARGELCYLPITRNGRTFHLLLAGVGRIGSTGGRQRLDASLVEAIAGNVRGLGLSRVGISRSDLGEEGHKRVMKALSELPLCIML